MSEDEAREFQRILDEGEESFRERTVWGPWHLEIHNQVLGVLLLKGLNTYEIPLDECVDSASILDSITQISGKTWASREMVGHLVKALDDLSGGMQGTVCGSGQNRSFDLNDLVLSVRDVKPEDAEKRDERHR